MACIDKVSLMEFFKNEVDEFIDRTQINLSDEAQFYLINMLHRFATIKNLTAQIIATETNTFAELMLKSNTVELNKRIFILRHTGDKALFISGLFSEQLGRKIISVDYIINIGISAYAQLYDLTSHKRFNRNLSSIFYELANKFISIVNVLNNMSDELFPLSGIDLLRIYERWLITRNPADERKLKGNGIMPLPSTMPKTIQ